MPIHVLARVSWHVLARVDLAFLRDIIYFYLGFQTNITRPTWTNLPMPSRGGLAIWLARWQHVCIQWVLRCVHVVVPL